MHVAFTPMRKHTNSQKISNATTSLIYFILFLFFARTKKAILTMLTVESLVHRIKQIVALIFSLRISWFYIKSSALRPMEQKIGFCTPLCLFVHMHYGISRKKVRTHAPTLLNFQLTRCDSRQCDNLQPF